MKYYDYLDNEEENKIKHVLENETKSDALHGIIVLGVDNYVIVNEMYGRQYGEFILRHVNDIILDVLFAECPAEERAEIPVYGGLIVLADMVHVTPASKIICDILRCHIFIIFSDMIKKLTDDPYVASKCALMSSSCHTVNTISLHQPFVIVLLYHR